MGLVLGVVLFACFLVFALGTLRKVIRYASTPAPLKIPTTPAPTTRSGVVLRLTREVVLFESLFKASKWTWVFGWLFHFGLLLVLMSHLVYFTESVWWWVVIVSGYSTHAGIMMIIGLTGLLGRRLLVDRVRYISAPSDYLMLVFLMLLAGSGLAMRFWFYPNILEVRNFALGLMSFNFGPLSFHPVLLFHLSLVAILLLIFPFSKLLHAPGLFFSPSRNQVDNPRERRHIASWAKKLSRDKTENHRG